MNKKLIKILIIVAFLLSMVGCASTTKVSKDTDKNKTTEKYKMTEDEKTFKNEIEILNGKESEQHKGTYHQSITIPEDNNVVILNDDNILDKLRSQKGIFYFGFDWCPWCRRMLPSMFEAVKESKLETVYYYNFYDVRDAYINNTDENKARIYAEIVDIVGARLAEYIEGTEMKRIGAPTVFAVNKGKVLGIYSGIPDDYIDVTKELTKKQKKEIKDGFNKLFSLVGEICTKDSKC